MKADGKEDKSQSGATARSRGLLRAHHLGWKWPEMTGWLDIEAAEAMLSEVPGDIKNPRDREGATPLQAASRLRFSEVEAGELSGGDAVIVRSGAELGARSAEEEYHGRDDHHP